jgi:hypothetical protein
MFATCLRNGLRGFGRGAIRPWAGPWAGLLAGPWWGTAAPAMLTVAATLTIGAAGAATPPPAPPGMAQAVPTTGTPTPDPSVLPAHRALSSAEAEARARAAAERILRTLRDGDANARFAQFSRGLQAISSPSMVAATMRTQPKLLRWTITSIVPGVDSSTIEATLETSAGKRKLLMAVNADGKLQGYHFDASDRPAEKVVRDFMQALSNGHFISASSFISPGMQAEIRPAGLQQKWQNLQRITGQFVRVRQISLSEHTADMKLVLVTTEFTRLTDNLFVVLDASNQIIGVDFPTEPAAPRSSR